MKLSYWLLSGIIALAACGKKTSQQEDSLYSKHLQRKVTLTVINTPIDKDKNGLDALILNDGQYMQELGVKNLLDSLIKEKAITNLVVIGIHSGDRKAEYGISSTAPKTGTGSKADNYNDFFKNELYPYIKKQAGTRKFNRIAIAGMGEGGLSAFDLAWNNADKINSLGIFSGAFSRSDQTGTDSLFYGALYNELKKSRKRPKLKYWLYTGTAGDIEIKNDEALQIQSYTAAVDSLLQSKSFTSANDVVLTTGAGNDFKSWRAVLPDFISWAFPK